MIYDFLGVGFGPSNIALAVSMDDAGAKLDTLYIERQKDPRWHADMLLEGSDTQHNMLRDFITPVNPRSKYGFVSYLHQSGRFFEFLNVGRHYPLRKDFYAYVQWVARQFDNVRYGESVESIQIDGSGSSKLWSVTTSSGAKHRARALVMGTGRNLNIPKGLEGRQGIIHASRYLGAVRDLPRTARIVVVGASQSAVEIILDLRSKGFQNIVSLHRSFSFRLKDTSPFSDEVYFPEFIDYYHALSPQKRAALDAQVRQTNYSCADRDVVDALYRQLYEERLDGRCTTEILRSHDIVSVNGDGPLVLDVRDVYTDARQRVPADLVVLATGYLDIGRNGREGLPWLLRDLAPHLKWSGDHLSVERDYRAAYADAAAALPDLYLNGLCESSHGMGDAGSFSLVSLRGRVILNSILDRRGKHEGRVYDVRSAEAAVR